MATATPWSPSSFTPAHRDYAKVKLTTWAITWGVILLASLIPAVLAATGAGIAPWLVLTPILLVLLLALLALRIIRRQVAALGYLEREEDFIVRSGVMWRKQVVIPYGRMQYVEVNSGPLERRYGLCQLTLNTAGTGATAHVYGLPEREGQELRERLVAAGEEQML
ncbi:PH domain-containing protein [Glutamicibacter nicotianae]|uniref:PH domain-containing protein n=1 Tax=Glutamicibacter nicotianae TaxID=37929 RepID=UPI00195D21FA|nr:PH domain-containing protein [Glutamicibacter nicotianae]MBM7766957.1 membrane protein YdbS with pleckstrin-like domain [Glutamicibacter nicotianae]